MLSDLEQLGFDPEFWPLPASDEDNAGALGRVSAEQRGFWTVTTTDGERLCRVGGRLRNAIDSGDADLPAVGDWVVLRPNPSEGQHVIDRVLPRRTRLARRAAGGEHREQVVAANVDRALVVCALGRDTNARRIERFVSVAVGGGVDPIIVLTKADLFEDTSEYVERARNAAPHAPVHLVSVISGVGLPELAQELTPGRTLVLLGTSGAGKSTLVNHWLGKSLQTTGEVRSDGKGRHTTTGRQLITLPSGAIVIDTPGVREVGLWSADAGISRTFEDLEELAQTCRFGNCQHDAEPGCALLRALGAGELDAPRLDSYRRLLREQAHVHRENDRLLASERRAGDKRIARAIRHYYTKNNKRG